LQGNPSATAGTVAARPCTHHRHWRRVNPRATASTGKQRDLSQPLLLFPSSPAVTTTVTCKRRKKRKQSFGSSSPF